jgi:Flp pilus assembly protein TadG
MSTIWKTIRRHLAAFHAARRGNVAVMFALTIVPIIAIVGFAVDYTRANQVKTELQAALDSTALMMSKSAGTLSQEDLQTQANSYFKALFDSTGVNNINISASYSTSGGATLTVNGSADVPTTFLAVLGYKDLTVDGSSTTKWGSSRLRVALVLDNTGSMVDDDKIGALKTATKALLTQLQNAVTTPGDVYVSIIPFVKDVSVDMTAYDSSWDSWIQWDDGTDNSWDGSNGTCSMGNKSKRSSCTAQSYCSISGYNSQSSCTAAGTCSVSGNNSQSSCNNAGTCSISGNNSQSSCNSAGTCSISGKSTQSSCENAGVCSNSSYTSKNKCTKKGYTWTTGVWTSAVWTAGVWTPGVWTQATWTPNAHNTWNGCITDRGTSTAPGTSAGYDQDVTAPTPSIPATLFPAEQYSACPKSMLGLNYDWSNMATYVGNMSANGNTNQPIGLVWGWQSLAGGGPFSVPSFDPNYNYQQIIILLSDGLNTQDRWYSSQSSIDNRMLDSSTGNGTCANIKAAGITIYTIQVNTGGDPTSALLKNCASNTTGTTDHFFLLTSADQIVTTFQTIGTNLTKLRIAQ